VPLTPSERGDIAVAARVLETHCPSVDDRRAICAQLIRSVGVANRLSPRSWATTLQEDGFRLNVGAVEAYWFFSGRTAIFVVGSAPQLSRPNVIVDRMRYGHIAQQHWRITFPVSYTAEIAAELWDSHKEYLEEAALTADGRPRGTSFHTTHSAGLIDYANKIPAA